MHRLKLNGKILLVYLLGNLILAFGVCLNTKTSLGVSPVTSVPFNLSQILPIPFSFINFAYLCFLILVQFALLRKASSLTQFSQILASFLLSFFIQIFDPILLVPDHLVWRVLALCLGIVATGIGVSLSVGMRVIPISGDALADVIGRITGRGFGFGKNVLDAVSITVSILLGLIFKGSLLGIGPGTVLAMICTGRVVALVHPMTERLYQKWS